jgi:hypothetical protein
MKSGTFSKLPAIVVETNIKSFITWHLLISCLTTQRSDNDLLRPSGSISNFSARPCNEENVYKTNQLQEIEVAIFCSSCLFLIL